MASFKTFKANFLKYYNQFYSWFLWGLYWGSVPGIIIYGLLAKPYSPLITGLLGIITGEEHASEHQPMGY